MNKLTVEKLKFYVAYEPTTGNFIWLACRHRKRNGTVAGSINIHQGYAYFF